MGKNQRIALVIHGSILVFSGALVLFDKATGEQWLSFAMIYGPTAVASILFPSAHIKAAKAKNGNDQ